MDRVRRQAGLAMRPRDLRAYRLPILPRADGWQSILNRWLFPNLAVIPISRAMIERCSSAPWHRANARLERTQRPLGASQSEAVPASVAAPARPRAAAELRPAATLATALQ